MWLYGWGRIVCWQLEFWALEQLPVLGLSMCTTEPSGALLAQKFWNRSVTLQSPGLVRPHIIWSISWLHEHAPRAGTRGQGILDPGAPRLSLHPEF